MESKNDSNAGKSPKRFKGENRNLGESTNPIGPNGNRGGNTPMLMERTEDMSEVIVRRLMPLECVRLQGYPDSWLDLPERTEEEMTDKEVDFWNDVRHTKSIIDGKKFKILNKSQIIKWYNSMVKTDSNKYKAMGNSIALPQWFWLFQKMKPYLGEGATMASLFDGVGGFPLTWEETFGEGTARWASEVEPYPIAVTMYQFGNEELGIAGHYKVGE